MANWTSTPHALPIAGKKRGNHNGGVLQRTIFCKFYAAGACQRGNACSFAHGPEELVEKPDLRKTRLCAEFKSFNTCQQGGTCDFAHGHHELKQICRNRDATELPSPSDALSPGLVQHRQKDQDGSADPEDSMPRQAVPSFPLEPLQDYKEEGEDDKHNKADVSGNLLDLEDISRQSTREDGSNSLTSLECGLGSQQTFDFGSRPHDGYSMLTVSLRNTFLHFEAQASPNPFALRRSFSLPGRLRAI